MRQLGTPPAIDALMNDVTTEQLQVQGFTTIDADGSVGGKDYVARILGLIRSTAFTVAIFSEETRVTAMANIALELGFAAMCGKPLIIIKSPDAAAPSDLKRTDWIDYNPAAAEKFGLKLNQALVDIRDLCEWERDLLQVAIDARSPDCAVALERAIKGFLLSRDVWFVDAAATVLNILDKVEEGNGIADLERLRKETRTFIRQARKSLLE
jgi:hypothetical protein